MKLNHLHIKATSVEETRRFYERYFGFREAFVCHEDAAFLIDEGGFLLAIFPYQRDEKPFKMPSWFHFGFCLTDESRVRELYADMRVDGVEFARPLKEFDDGTVNFYCLDPAGSKVEVSWNPQESALFKQPALATRAGRLGAPASSRL